MKNEELRMKNEGFHSSFPILHLIHLIIPAGNHRRFRLAIRL